MYKSSVFFLMALLGISACSNNQQQDETLRLLDISHPGAEQEEVFVKPKTDEEIKTAYYNYIKHAPTTDKSRRSAINRLAELEMNRLNELVKNAPAGSEDALEDVIYRESLQKTLTLLQTSLREYPDAKTNDQTLYQLARTYDQLGDPEQSLAALVQLSEKYPTSPHYAEAQFRIGENAFIERDYIAAEDAYSEAIFTSVGDAFYERSLFKRGWARYKQGLYIEAADDYLAALKSHQFGDYDTLSANDKDQFDEYFRAIGLTFANLQSAETVQGFFADEADFKYLYQTYKVISDIYVQQERYSDAAETLNQFIAANPALPEIPLAHLKIIEIWKVGEFKNRFQDALEIFYSQFHPKSHYWKTRQQTADYKAVVDALRDYSLQVTGYYQDAYIKTRKQEQFNQANLWYQRYLEHYSAYARQDKVYLLYAELLALENRNEEAIRYFELAAYDGDIILNKEAAYATIDLSNRLHQLHKTNPEWLDKHIRYSLTSAQLYPGDSRYHRVALHAAELAFNNGRFDKAIALVNTLPDTAGDKMLYAANVIKGLAYQRSHQYKDAEIIFAGLLTLPLDKTEQTRQSDNLALSIYRQAELELNNQDAEAAIQNFARIARSAPNSEIAPTALYEAISLSMKHQQWNNAISYIQEFQQIYPKHALYKDATRQLSSAYLSSGQGIKAAQAFEQISEQEENQDIKMAALWQAAELYESKNNFVAAIRSYKTYANTYTRPYPQYLESMYKLTQLYQKTRESDKVVFWQEKIATSDKQAAKSSKTERTNQIAAQVMLELAKFKHAQFTQQQLVEPLADNLRVKKKLMQESISLYGQASVYSYTDITTEATYAIANIYQAFAAALLNSERPKALKGEELEQYNILIEDQAFPFEEKAIEFYEINMSRIKDGTASTWITRSHAQLRTLFPVRYNRKGKLDIYQFEKR